LAVLVPFEDNKVNNANAEGCLCVRVRTRLVGRDIRLSDRDPKAWIVPLAAMSLETKHRKKRAKASVCLARRTRLFFIAGFSLTLIKLMSNAL